jgi:hypothetical protein
VPDLDYDAELEDWRVIVTRSGLVLTGRVYGDRNRRFADGTMIHTSLVVTPLGAIEAGQTVTTLNSRYWLRPVDVQSGPARSHRRLSIESTSAMPRIR